MALSTAISRSSAISGLLVSEALRGSSRGCSFLIPQPGGSLQARLRHRPQVTLPRREGTPHVSGCPRHLPTRCSVSLWITPLSHQTSPVCVGKRITSGERVTHVPTPTPGTNLLRVSHPQPRPLQEGRREEAGGLSQPG
ncbi:hypothetical protein HJG60_009359 [Phyllostomus discolor]|uniref:Uncharacterized protein n=1 Tax=Phyllostomus discolor TaxID=89673 RepID=A0A833YGA8_9CHIR|nr:hypothetical protein HJG60_009359 [Phyllostomus discolor]